MKVTLFTKGHQAYFFSGRVMTVKFTYIILPILKTICSGKYPNRIEFHFKSIILRYFQKNFVFVCDCLNEGLVFIDEENDLYNHCGANNEQYLLDYAAKYNEIPWMMYLYMSSGVIKVKNSILIRPFLAKSNAYKF